MAKSGVWRRIDRVGMAGLGDWAPVDSSIGAPVIAHSALELGFF